MFSVGGCSADAPYPFQPFTVAFCRFEFRGELAGVVGGSVRFGEFDGCNFVGAFGDPGVEVFDGFLEIGGGVWQRGVEGVCPEVVCYLAPAPVWGAGGVGGV